MLRIRITPLVFLLLAACSSEPGPGVPARLAGRLVTAERNPVAGWLVTPKEGIAAARTGADGRFALEPLTAGTYTFLASPETGLGYLRVHAVVRGGDSELGDLVLPAGLRLKVSAEDSPASVDARLFLDGEPYGVATLPALWEIADLTPGSHVVRIEADTLPPVTRHITASSGEIGLVEITLFPAAVTAVYPPVAEWGDVVELRGVNLAHYAIDGRVSIDDVQLPVLFWDAEAIGVRVPEGLEPGDRLLSVELGPHSVLLPIGIRPTVLSATLQGGGEISVLGVNLGTPSGSVLLSGPAVTAPAILGWSPSHVTLAVDPHLPPGAYVVSLVSGYAALEEKEIMVSARALMPLNLTVTGATAVWVPGANFGAAGTATVGGVPVEGLVWSAGGVTFQAGPTAPPGAQPVVLWAGAKPISAGTVTVRPTIVAVSPQYVNPLGEIALAGANFGIIPGALTIGGAPASVLTWGPRLVRALVPAAAPPGVTAVVLLAAGEYANPVTIAVAVTLAAPSGLVALPATVPTVHLRWTDNSADETGFEVERKAGDGAYSTLFSLAGNTTAAADTDVAAGVRYAYRVRAIRNANVSAYGAEAVLEVPLIGNLWGGLEHACGSSWGEPRCWGSNTYAQLGTATASAEGVSVPTALVFAAPVSDGFAGSYHGCAVTTEGRLYCWGSNQSGQIGTGTASAANVPAPLPITAVSAVKSGAAGDSYSCVLDASGEVYCWGANGNGQVGNGSAGGSVLTPVRVAAVSGAQAVSIRFAHTCALRNGKVYCWGANSRAQVGNGSATPTSITWPTQAVGIDTATGVAAAFNHTCAVLAAGTVKCWGRNNYGQIGANLSGNPGPITYPTLVSAPVHYNGGTGMWDPEYPGALTGVVTLTAGTLHTCALTAWGKVYCWGQNDAGSYQLGLDSTPHSCYGIPCSQVPVSVDLPGPAALVRAGGSHTCALLIDGRGYCWGRNATGAVGDGTRTTKAGISPINW